MALNHLFWAHQFEGAFVPEVRALLDTLETRLLPTFANIKAEADNKEQELERLGSLPGDGSDDMADLAERAFETRLAHYQMMTSIRQGLLNMFAVALFHLYEQHVMIFHRREVLEPGEENDPKFLKHSVFRERLRNVGIDVDSFASSPVLEELGLVANTVKHAVGDSSAKLHERRPALFQSPELAGFNLKSVGQVFAPLMGEDLYVSLEELKRYADAVVQFWEELSNALSLV